MMIEEIEQAQKIADEAFENAPIENKTESELRIETLEEKIVSLEGNVISLQTQVSELSMLLLES